MGLWVTQGDGNVICGNECTNNGNASFGTGILVGVPAFFNRGTPVLVHDTVVIENTAFGQNKSIGIQNGRYFADLYDVTADYAGCGNEWSDNVFEKDNETGANAGPGVGCVQ